MRRLLCVPEDARDEEAGEYEKQVDPAPTGRSQLGDEPHSDAASGHSQGKVVGQDKQDCQPAYPVKRRDVTGEVGEGRWYVGGSGSDPTYGPLGRLWAHGHGVRP